MNQLIEVRLPSPRTFKLRYRKANGEVKSYVISNPIAMTEDSFTSYAFNAGIKTFKNSRVMSLIV
jgi:GH24 family phage-related lysozyme (muramidase)